MQVPHEGLVSKLQKLNPSQASIETVSQFCIFFHKDARGVVRIWESEFYGADQERRLALLYLANHVLQEGRKKGSAFQDEFFKVLPKAITTMMRAQADDKTRRAVTRLVAVWEERRVFGSRHLKSFKEVLVAGPSEPAAPAARAGSGSSAGGASHKSSTLVEALRAARQRAQAAQQLSAEHSATWRPELLTSGTLADMSSAQQRLAAYVAALEAEATGRRDVLSELAAEQAKQQAYLRAAEAALASAQASIAQVQQRMAALAAAAPSGGAYSSYGGSGNGAGVAGGPARSPPAPELAGLLGGSPQAPGLEDDDDQLGGLIEQHLPPHLQPQPLQHPQHLPPQQQQQQQPPPPLSAGVGPPEAGPGAAAGAGQFAGDQLQQLIASGALAAVLRAAGAPSQAPASAASYPAPAPESAADQDMEEEDPYDPEHPF